MGDLDDIAMVGWREGGKPDPDPHMPPRKVWGYRLARFQGESGESYGPGTWMWTTNEDSLPKIRAAGYEVVEYER